MQYKPHDYQQYVINYILEHPIVAVILGMGLGKTSSITLTAIEQLMYGSFEISKVLVAALKDVLGDQKGQQGDLVIPVYLGNQLLDEVIVTAQQRMSLRSGGR